MTTVVTVGRWNVLKSELEGITITEALERFKDVNEKRVRTAWKMANPKPEKKTEKQTKEPIEGSTK